MMVISLIGHRELQIPKIKLLEIIGPLHPFFFFSWIRFGASCAAWCLLDSCVLGRTSITAVPKHPPLMLPQSSTLYLSNVTVCLFYSLMKFLVCSVQMVDYHFYNLFLQLGPLLVLYV
jgi:hypothetical protein